MIRWDWCLVVAPCHSSLDRPLAMDVEELATLFGRVGIEANKATETAKNKKLAKNFEEAIHEAGCAQGTDRPVGLLLYTLAATCPANALKHRAYIAGRVAARDLKSEDQLQAAYKFVAALPEENPIDKTSFDAACGVGVKVSEETVRNAVEMAVETHREGLLRDRYAYNMATIMKSLRGHEDLRWADKKLMKELVDARVADLLGPRDSEEEIRKRKRESNCASPTTAEAGVRMFVGEVAQLHRPGENPQISEEIRQKHLQATGGKVVTRFPPEPNGFLHIGHAKAINLNFRYAEAHGGQCYLRFDDTNPEAEEPRYYEAIKSNVEWLGFTPYKMTAASDYFQELYECALTLIQKGRAYVCHMNQEDISLSRGGADGKGARYNSPWRERSVEENLAEFEKMRSGQYEEGAACLRLKQDMQSGNPFMWDLVAYRVLRHPHCRTGTTWCIYPMYDFTHCLCDSLENITHSMCTTEFINAREAYYWVCDNVEVYKAVQWEYGRLNITNTVLSKRKLTKLVDAGIISSWDDPRVYTLAALRRRGFTPRAINAFVEEIGVTTAFSVVDVKKLEAHVRDDLNKSTLRRMAILDPLLVKITNLADDFEELLSIPNDPRDLAKGDSLLPLTNQLYIDRSDFRTEDDPNFFRLTPNQAVGIYRVGVLSCTRYETDADGKVTLIEGTINRADDAPKPKTFITWVPLSEKYNSPLKAEIRLYSALFKSRNPDNAPGGYLNDVNPQSLTIIEEALVDPRLTDAHVEDKFQFQRVGYFCVDPDSTDKKLVFNLTVSIKEDPNKN
ncbi:Glutamine-tRNA ligase [Paramicrosporidium saccamoebae]|uniref:glutamine--tRNA ligase n=1 Tax=Paramicrosporidium saccamoebae TaxID=1246581 RepID=A0A2H9TN03_9FUNG|nr:Glutamine-tRNA ligase [Paramicrosporidium saccamoebae]